LPFGSAHVDLVDGIAIAATHVQARVEQVLMAGRASRSTWLAYG